MTYLEADRTILTQVGEPLHYAEITRRALEQNLIQPSGLTPDATMGSRLYTETKQEGTEFARVGRGIFGLAKQQPSGIDAQVQRINQETRAQLRELLHTMPPDRFESLIMELLLQMGFDENTVAVTPYGGDGGIDVNGVYRAAGLTEVSAAVQAKRWKRNVQAPVVTQLRGSLQVHQQGILITTSDFSKGARKEAAAANKTRIGLINGDELIELLIKHGVGVQEKTLRVVGLDDEWWGELFVEDEDLRAVADVARSPTNKQTPTITAVPGLPTRAELTAQPSLLDADLAQTMSDPTGRKPAAVTVLDQTYPVDTWKSLLLTVCNALVAHHGEEFAERAAAIKGRKRHYFVESPEGMINPAPVKGSTLWVETNLSAKNALDLILRLLHEFGHDAACLQIKYR